MHRRRDNCPPLQAPRRLSRLRVSRPKTICTPGCRPGPLTAALSPPMRAYVKGTQNQRAKT